MLLSSGHFGHLLLAASIVAGAAGHTLLKHVVASVPGAGLLPSLSGFLDAALLGRLALALLLLVISFGAWLGAIRHLNVSYAYAMASASIIIVALFAAAFLGERIEPKVWLGLVLILAGCALIVPVHGAR